MNRKRVVYTGILIIIAVIVSITYFSYAFLTNKDEQHGKINVVVGNLDYKIESNDLDSNNSITAPAKSSKALELKVTSLNSIDTKYELYYETDNNDVVIKYSTLKDSASSNINHNNSKTILLNITNNSSNDANITFKLNKGFAHNELTQISGKKINQLNPITITFNSDGGSSVNNKILKYGESYGTLTSPIKTGYTFLGWHGKNMLPIISNNNYICGHFQERTTHEINEEYIRINGYQGTENIDTSWNCRALNKLNLNTDSNYILSLNVRSKTMLASRITKPLGTSDGKTGIYEYNLSEYGLSSLKAPISNTMEFTADEKWHKLQTTFDITTNITNGQFVIGNDLPNLYGINSYLDISRIQLENGSISTDYEPYIIDSNTKMYNTNNYTLTALWEANTYTVTFNSNGGTGTMTNQTLTYDSEQQLKQNTFTKSGYKFRGWSTVPVPDMTNIITNITLGRNFTLEDGKYICDQTQSTEDSYIRIYPGLTKNLRYVLLFDATNLPNPTTLAFGYPSQSNNSTRLHNGVNMYQFTAPETKTETILDDTVKDAKAKLIASNFSLYQTNTVFDKVYYDKETVKNLVPSGNITLYAIWEK